MPPKGKGRDRKSAPREVKEFEEYMLQLDRVTRVVKGGRRMRFRATVVIGNRAGKVGLGLGKGNDVQIAVRKAVHDAKKHIVEVPIVNDTIPHALHCKYKAAKTLIKPAVAGTGLIAGGATRKILELAGVKNVLSKNFGTNNGVVVAQGTIKMLQSLRMTESAKQFIANLQKEAEEKRRKENAVRAEADKGPRTRGKRPNAPAAAEGEGADLKKNADKLKADKEEGRLEKELKEKSQ